MIAERESVESIRTYLVSARFRNLTGNSKLTDAEVGQTAALLDEVSPSGVFKELRKALKTEK